MNDVRNSLMRSWPRRGLWIAELAELCLEDIFTDAHEYRRQVGRAQSLAIAIKGGPDPKPMEGERE